MVVFNPGSRAVLLVQFELRGIKMIKRLFDLWRLLVVVLNDLQLDLNQISNKFVSVSLFVPLRSFIHPSGQSSSFLKLWCRKRSRKGSCLWVLNVPSAHLLCFSFFFFFLSFENDMRTVPFFLSFNIRTLF